MRHICSGEDICGMVKKDDRGGTIHVSDQMDRCAERNPSARIIHCGAARVNVSFERGQKGKKAERVESLYMLRDMRLFKDESKAEFLSRMKRAQNGAYEKKPGMRI